MHQLLTRMKMTFIGDETTVYGEYSKTFRTVLMIFLCYSIILSIFGCPPDDIEEDEDGMPVMVLAEDCASWQRNLTSYVSTCFGVYVFIVMVRLRMAIRAKYSIPEESG